MPRSARYLVSLTTDRAYRSEIALFRHERLTAKDCMVIQTQIGASALYLVEGRRSAVTVTSDIAVAWTTFQRTKAMGLCSFAVVD